MHRASRHDPDFSFDLFAGMMPDRSMTSSRFMLLKQHQRFAQLIFGAVVLVGLCDAPCASAAAATLPAQARNLPATGTTWCYSIGAGRVTPMTLTGVTSNIASYEAGGGSAPIKIDEQVDTYSTLNATRHGQRRLLDFPVVKDKRWSDEFDETVTSQLGHDASWQYHYHAVALSQVGATQKLKVGAGTFDTFVIERTTAWTKSDPHSSSAMLHAQHCDDASCSVSGFSKEVFWYAPSIGRAVLRAYTQSGDSSYVANQTPDDMLHDAGTLVTELVGYGDNATCAAPHASLQARTPSSPWYGFALWSNDTWEFLMTRDMARE
jgi:hypothetical protein